jgi:hypothetical protein
LLFLVISILPQGGTRPRLADTVGRDGIKPAFLT